MKDIKNIRQDFHLAAWVMPQGWHLGILWGVGGGVKKMYCEIQSDLVCVTYIIGTCSGTIFFSPNPLGPLEGPKAQI